MQICADCCHENFRRAIHLRRIVARGTSSVLCHCATDATPVDERDARLGRAIAAPRLHHQPHARRIAGVRWPKLAATTKALGLGYGADFGYIGRNLCGGVCAASVGATSANRLGHGAVFGDRLAGRRILVSRGIVFAVAANAFGQNNGDGHRTVVWVVTLAISRVWVYASSCGADWVYVLIGLGVWGTAWADTERVGGGGLAFGGEFDRDNCNSDYPIAAIASKIHPYISHLSQARRRKIMADDPAEQKRSETQSDNTSAANTVAVQNASVIIEQLKARLAEAEDKIARLENARLALAPDMFAQAMQALQQQQNTLSAELINAQNVVVGVQIYRFFRNLGAMSL